MQLIERGAHPIIEDTERKEAAPEKTGKRLTVHLGPETVGALDRISDGGTKSYAEIIRDAIWLEERVTSVLSEGGKLYFQTPQGEWHMVVLR